MIDRIWRAVLHRLKQVLIALDQLANALLPGGWADETFSARCWRLRERSGWGTARYAIDAAARLLGDEGHCQTSYESEVKRLQCPPALRPGGASQADA